MGGRYGGSGYRPGASGSPGLSTGSAPTFPGDLGHLAGSPFRSDISGVLSQAFGGDRSYTPRGSVPSSGTMRIPEGWGRARDLRSLINATKALALLLKETDQGAYGITFDTTGYDHNCGPRDPGPYLYRTHGPYGVPGEYVCIGLGSWGEPLQPGKVYGGIGSAVTWLSGPLSGATGQYEGWKRSLDATGAPAYQTVNNDMWDYDLLKYAVNAQSAANLAHSLGLDVPPHTGGIEDRRTLQDIADEAAEYADWLAQQAEDADWLQDPFSDATAPAVETGGVPDVFPAPPDPLPWSPPKVTEVGPGPTIEIHPRPEEIWQQDLYPNRWRPGRDKKHRPAPIPGIGTLTEAGDYLECFWKGLDKADQTKVKHPRYFDAKKGKWVTKILTDDKGRPITHPRPQDMAKDIYNAKGGYDLAKVMNCIRDNFLEDYAIGKSARKGNEGLLRMNPNRPVGLGTGPAL